MTSCTPRRTITGANAWHGAALARSGGWHRRLSAEAVGEIDRALAEVRRRGIPWPEITRKDFPLGSLATELAEIGRELEEGPGIVKLSGLPVERYGGEELKAIFFGIASHLGTPVYQSAKAELIGEICDEGPEAARSRGQIPAAAGGRPFLSSRARVQSTGALRFHTDRCDVVGLLCRRGAASGGISKVVSAVAIHNEMLVRRPDLLELLFRDYYRSRLGEEVGGARRFYALPVFTLSQGSFASHYSRTYIEAAQQFPEVPRLTADQQAALDLLAEIGEELCLEMTFEPGDMQFLNNHVIYHARTPYEDGPDPDQRRLLYRIWLSMPNSRPLPQAFRPLFGDVEAGALRGGIGQAM
jgi:hypothetical protein